LGIHFLTIGNMVPLSKTRFFCFSQNIFDILSLGMDTVIELINKSVIT
jgi:hypothetical protein